MNKSTRWYMASAIIAVIVIVVVALHHYSTSKSTTMNMGMSTAAVSTNSVGINNYMFSPMTIKIKAGTTVTWTNHDPVHHNIVADTASPNAPNGPLIGQGQTYSFKFTKAGTYTFHCVPHPYMHGTVVVTN